MKTKKLQSIWWEYLNTAEKLLRVLHEQTAAVMLRDLERLERIQPNLEKLLDELVNIDETAVDCAREITDSIGVERSFKALIKALDEPEAQELQALANNVKAKAHTVQSVIQKNQELIMNELAFVAGSLHLIAKTAEQQEGQFGIKSHAAVLIDQRA